MNRQERTRILVMGDRTVLDRMAREIESAYELVTVKEPIEELVMLKVRESAQRTQFYLGEALMTSCVVRLGKTYGYGMVLGEDHQKALDLAVVDAAYAAEGSFCAAHGFDELLRQEHERLQEAKRLRNEALLKTQVDFSTMEA